jgi:hypothetical protein
MASDEVAWSIAKVEEKESGLPLYQLIILYFE